MLVEMSESNDRSIGGQISYLTKQQYLFQASNTKNIDKNEARG